MLRLRIFCLSWLAVVLNVPVALGDPGANSIWISIENKYKANIDMGPLGKSTRDGKDRIEGVLERQGSEYVGIVDAVVESTLGTSGLAGTCGPSRYEDSQKLRVTGHVVDGFNANVQTITFDPATNTGSQSSEFLLLEFVPETATTQQPQTPSTDQVVACHTLIETPSGTSFLPLNDSRWTQPGGGYIIATPSSGVLNYTDNTVAVGDAQKIGPFVADESVWTIKVESR
jgi:hypothetical protein